MNLKEKITLLIRLDRLIKIKGTGAPDALAQRLGISRSALYRYLDVLKQFGAPVDYCHVRETYFYADADFQLFLG